MTTRIVADHFHRFGIGEEDWLLDRFPTVGAPLRTLAPVAVIECPEAYRAAAPTILGSRTKHGRTTAMSGGVMRGIGDGCAHVGVCVLSYGGIDAFSQAAWIANSRVGPDASGMRSGRTGS